MPEARHLAAIRANIDANPQRITRILSNSGIRKDFLGNVGQDGTKVVKAFASHNAESALKTKPKASKAWISWSECVHAIKVVLKGEQQRGLEPPKAARCAACCMLLHGWCSALETARHFSS